MKKKCTKCSKELPATKEFFQKNKQGKYGLRSVCKNCLNKNLPKKTEIEKKQRAREKYKAWALINRPRKTIKDNPLKICGSCEKELPRTDEFFRRRSDYKSNFRSDCRECYDEKSRKRHKKHYKDNVEKEKKRAKYFYYRNLDYTNKKQREYRNNNIEIFKERDKARIDNLSDSYIALLLKKSVKDVPIEIIEQKRLIIKLKRELKKM